MTDPQKMSDQEALAELNADNLRRANVLVNRKKLHPAAYNAITEEHRIDAFMEHVMRLLGGTEAVMALGLDMAGRISRWLDEVERNADKPELVVANGKVPRT